MEDGGWRLELLDRPTSVPQPPTSCSARAAASASVENSVSLNTDGDLALRAAGALTSEARIQNLTATLGDVNVRANDDVKMQGERIRMNC